MTRYSRLLIALAVAALCAALGVLAVAAPYDDFDAEPIRYTATPSSDDVARLADQIAKGEVRLPRHRDRGYLDALLQVLKISPHSQTLVFSKTSFQHDRISPATPRALYFNDNVYVGWVQGAPVLEIGAVDPILGAVFYTISQEEPKTPRPMRQNFECLSCHNSTLTGGVPGFTIRSVFPSRDGRPILSAGTHVTRDESPVEERWGGWYVTGTHGRQTHMGNVTLSGEAQVSTVDWSRGANVTDLDRFFNTESYLTPNSDLVALVVLQHQVNLHNLITRAGYETRKAVHYEQTLARELGRLGERLESTKGRIRSGCEPLVKGLLFSGAARLEGPLRGNTPFAAEFQKQGPRDSKGRSLRDLDLQHGFFRYPCSFLIHSPAFTALPPEAKSYIFTRMKEILDGRDNSKEFAHLTPAARAELRDILTETLPGFSTAPNKPTAPAAPSNPAAR